MERYHIYKLGIAILFYAVYCRRPMVVNGLEVGDGIGTLNDNSTLLNDYSNDDYYVYYQGVQGKPGVDFPVFARIPRTGFSCKEVESGYYADLETDCQVFHICNEGTKVSFLCPNGTIFQQSDLICDWWFKVNCTNSPNLYEESAEQLRESHIRRKASRRVTNNSNNYNNNDNADVHNNNNYNNNNKADIRSNNNYNNNNNNKADVRSNNNYNNNNNNKAEVPFKSQNVQQFIIEKPQQKFHKQFSEPQPLTLDHNRTPQPLLLSLDRNRIPQPQPFTHDRNRAQPLTLDRSQNLQRKPEIVQMTDRKMDVFDDPKVITRGEKRYNQNIGNYGQNKANVYNYHESEEMQIPQETAGFYKSKYNNIEITKKDQSTTNPYPNHRETYSDVRSSNYYTNLPNPSTPAPQQKSTINNGKPFVVSTPKLGVYTTERTTFKYSPTVPTTRYSPTVPPITKPTQAPVYSTYNQAKTTYGTRTPSSNTPKPYNNLPIETFTNPPSIANGKSTTPRKQKTKNSFTIGLNSLQGSISVKTQSTTTRPKTTPKKDVIKISLSSDGGAKSVKNKGRSYDFGNTGVTQIQNKNGVQPPKLLLENEIPDKPSTNRPSTGFFVTKTNTFRPAEFITSHFNSGSITGSKNTYIPTTRSPVYSTTIPTTTYTEYISNTYGFVKPTGVPKPKPFELPSSTERPITFTTASPYLEDFINPTLLPNYQISSASPFTNVPPTLPSSYHTTTYQPTYPTIYNGGQGFTTALPLSDHVYNMLDTLKEIANVRVAKQEDFDNPRPGLIVPPSVGPQTLHTLAVYFANALDGLVPENNSTDSPPETETTIDENLVINSLLSRKTVDKYNELFKEKPPADEPIAEEDTEEDNDLNSEHSSNAVQSPRVRQLAKVFTQALSSYLDDPDMFRKVLQQIRPTEPPPLQTLPTDNPDEDELLNFSDADIKPELPRLPTPAPANPTWGYILAFNNSDFKGNHIDNLENLQGADSQSFIAGYNDIAVNRVNKALKVPTNHWTSSPDVTKLWQTTLFVDPFAINDNLENTEPSISKEDNGGEELDESSTPAVSFVDDSSADLSELVTESVVDYELRALPRFELNSTQVHGLLIDFMNSTKNEDSNKLKRILTKLNTTEDEFLDKMKQIEENPITRRLILLLVSECANDKSLENKADTIRDIISLANSNESLQPSSTNWDAVALKSNLTISKQPSAFTKLVDPALKDEDQDSRALQLLNSLYSIASKYGK